MQTCEKTKPASQGFTLVEMLIVLMLLAVLSGVGVSLFTVGLRAWDAGQIRTGIREDASYAMERIVRDLKEMANGSLAQYASIAHAIQFSERHRDTYVFYLYNADDPSFDSSYGEGLYSLRKANITQGDDPASGEGTLILRDLVSPDAAPPATALNVDVNQVTLDLVLRRSEETVRIRTIVRPRNL